MRSWVSSPSWMNDSVFRARQAVGDAQQRQRMLLANTRRASLLYSLLDATTGDRAIGAHIVGIPVAHAREHRLADLHRLGVELALDAPRPVVARAALDRIHPGVGHPFQRFARFLPDFLNARVTRDVIADIAERLLELSLQQPVLVAQHE